MGRSRGSSPGKLIWQPILGQGRGRHVRIWGLWGLRDHDELLADHWRDNFHEEQQEIARPNPDDENRKKQTERIGEGPEPGPGFDTFLPKLLEVSKQGPMVKNVHMSHDKKTNASEKTDHFLAGRIFEAPTSLGPDPGALPSV